MQVVELADVILNSLIEMLVDIILVQLLKITSRKNDLARLV